MRILCGEYSSGTNYASCLNQQRKEENPILVCIIFTYFQIYLILTPIDMNTPNFGTLHITLISHYTLISIYNLYRELLKFKY